MWTPNHYFQIYFLKISFGKKNNIGINIEVGFPLDFGTVSICAHLPTRASLSLVQLLMLNEHLTDVTKATVNKDPIIGAIVICQRTIHLAYTVS